MLITLMFLVVAMKSKTFSSFSYLANEQVCGSREGAQTDRQPSWPMEIFHTLTSRSVYEWLLARGSKLSALLVSQEFRILSYAGVQMFWGIS